jgi:hypothetical protein
VLAGGGEVDAVHADAVPHDAAALQPGQHLRVEAGPRAGQHDLGVSGEVEDVGSGGTVADHELHAERAEELLLDREVGVAGSEHGDRADAHGTPLGAGNVTLPQTFAVRQGAAGSARTAALGAALTIPLHTIVLRL